tara:strand:- start:7809 stop:8255 length:447 start_codon:yes stop_codon:yes gene_type:complete
MKLTKTKLKRIIKEVLQETLEGGEEWGEEWKRPDDWEVRYSTGTGEKSYELVNSEGTRSKTYDSIDKLKKALEHLRLSAVIPEEDLGEWTVYGPYGPSNASFYMDDEPPYDLPPQYVPRPSNMRLSGEKTGDMHLSGEFVRTDRRIDN